jgi:hypothetical protein
MISSFRSVTRLKVLVAAYRWKNCEREHRTPHRPEISVACLLRLAGFD